jgi:hypothetical protein
MKIWKNLSIGLAVCISSCKDPTLPEPLDSGMTDARLPTDSTEDSIVFDSPVDAEVDALLLDAEPDAPPDAAPTLPHVNGSFAIGVNTDFPSNCGFDAEDVSSFQLSLFDSTGACIPTTFHLMNGTQEVAIAHSSCPLAPGILMCFDSPLFVLAQDLPVGGYHLLVEGFTVFGKCWIGDASIGVTETPSEQSLTLLRQPGCLD